jgi:putative salt-induced outer membrane protein
MMKHTKYYSAALLLSIVAAQPAHAQLPGPVRTLLDEALLQKDDDAVKAVFDLAKKTNPEEAEALDAELAAYNKARAVEIAAEEEAAKQAKFANNGLFENWSGQGELGGFRSSGNVNNTGITAGLNLEKKSENWRHKITALADFQRTDGITTKEQFLFAYEPNYTISDRLFAYGLAQYERDRFQGFSSRLSASAGLGYRVIDNEKMSLSVNAGPAFRQTNFIGGGSDSSIAALGALDFDWQIAERLKLTQDGQAFLQSSNTTLRSITGLEASLSDSLSARLAAKSLRSRHSAPHRFSNLVRFSFAFSNAPR